MTGASDIAGAAPTRRSAPTPTCCCTTWVAGWPTGARTALATGSEWRTAPLWGIGLVRTVNRHTRFLHDGRARDLSEAILWHGGEAHAARERFRSLPARERRELLAFLESL